MYVPFSYLPPFCTRSYIGLCSRDLPSLYIYHSIPILTYLEHDIMPFVTVKIYYVFRKK